MNNPAQQPKLKPLSTKQRAFVEHYLRCWNGYKAAIAAGYSETSARHQASRMLSYDNILAAIQERLTELKLDADEVLARVGEHARGDMADFLFIGEETVTIEDSVLVEEHSTDEPDDEEADEQKQPKKKRVVLRTVTAKRPTVYIDLAGAKQRGKLHLLKKVKDGKQGFEIELYDAQDALIKLGEYHRLWGKGDDILKYIDLSKLDNDQLNRIKNGDDPLAVLLNQ